MNAIKNIFLLVVITICFTGLAYSQNKKAVNKTIDGIYVSIDEAFLEKSFGKINDILYSNHDNGQYKEIESYTLNKIRQLVIKNDFDFARLAALCLLQNNIDNEDAMEMYVMLEVALSRAKTETTNKL